MALLGWEVPGQDRKKRDLQKCFSLGREVRAGVSESPIIPKLALEVFGTVPTDVGGPGHPSGDYAS